MMNLLILYHLLVDLTNEKDDLDAAMRVAGDSARQGDLERQIHQLVPLLAEIRSEISTCERPGTICTRTAQEFEVHLHHALKTFSPWGLPHCAEPPAPK